MPPLIEAAQSMPARHLLAPVAALAALAVAVGGCGSGATAPQGGAGFRVVAAENFWGSIATQLAGDHAKVTSIIVNPATDPHDYDATASDARTMAAAQLAIVNGVAYDAWASKLLAAGGASGRVTLDVGRRLGLRTGDNPHQWYDPASVHTFVAAVVADYTRIDPAGRAYYAARERAFETTGLARYDALRAEIRRRFAGVAVGYSESIFAPLGADLGLRLLTPPSFAEAIAEGTDVSAADKQAVDRQARTGQIKVWIFNSQNVTPDVQRVTQLVRRAHIPVATVTETLSPAGASFQQWQVAQLEHLRDALHQATGR